MPTKSNNIGGAGGKRSGAGAKKKALNDKISGGNAPKTIKILDLPDLKGAEMPKPADFFDKKQEDGQEFYAHMVYERTWKWLERIGCTALINPDLLERYAFCYARWMQCENLTSEKGFLYKHPTSGNACTSPYVNISVQYLNLASRLWDEIFQIVKENCTADYMADNPQDDMMEKLLKSKSG